MIKREVGFGILLLTILLSGCHEVDKVVVGGKIKDFWPQVSNEEFLRVRGVGVPPEKSVGFTRRRGLSRNSALVSARYEMLAVIKGVNVGGGLTVGQLMQTNSKISEGANRIISGATEVQSEWAADDGCVVTLEISREQIETLLDRDRAKEELAALPAMIGEVAKAVAGDVGALPGMTGAVRAVEPDLDTPTMKEARAIMARNKLAAESGFYLPSGLSGSGSPDRGDSVEGIWRGKVHESRGEAHPQIALCGAVLID